MAITVCSNLPVWNKTVVNKAGSISVVDKNKPMWCVGGVQGNNMPHEYKVLKNDDECRRMELPGTILIVGDKYCYIPIDSDCNEGVIIINANGKSAHSIERAVELAKEITAFLLITHPNGEEGSDGE